MYLWIILALSVVISFLVSPMFFIFSMWVLVVLFEKQLKLLLDRFPVSVAFIGVGIIFGLVTEVFAIIENLDVPPEQRILLHADPFSDLVLGFFYYLFVIGTWYLLVKRYAYTKKELFLITGVYGIFTEEMGQVFIRMITIPFYGQLYAVYIVFVYGIFPMLAYHLTQDRFTKQHSKQIVARILIASVFMFIQWALYGNLVYPLLHSAL